MRPNLEESSGANDDDDGLDDLLEDLGAFADNEAEDSSDRDGYHMLRDFIDGLRADSQEELYPGCKVSKFSFIVRLLYLKQYTNIIF